MQEEHRRLGADPRVGLVLVGFSPADRLAAIARRLGWIGPVLSDPDRALYQRLGIGRAPWWRVYTPATLGVYASAWRRRDWRPIPAQEDTRQLGADAVVVGGVAHTLWRPGSPDDRPPAGEVLAAAHAAVQEFGTSGEGHR